MNGSEKESKIEFKIKTKELDSANKQLIAILQLLCSLEISIAAMKWYVGEEAGRPELPPHEHIISLALNIASVGEALHKFEEFVFNGVINKSDSWSDSAKKSWEFLHSPEVIELKKKHLKFIRDKSAFHIDPQPVKNYLNKLIKEENQVTIWVSDDEGRNGHSPLAAEIIGNHLIDATFERYTTANLSSKVFGALRDIVHEFLSNEFNVSLRKTSI
jgi:hypothetical protein